MRDTTRPAKVEGSFKGYDFQFDVDNRGKRSIAVDLDSDDGQDIVHRLCATPTSSCATCCRAARNGSASTPSSCWATNPKLVHATLTGYGTDGPEAWRPGYDVTAFFGRSGLYDSMRDGARGPGADGPPGTGRPHHRAGARRRHPRGAAPGRTNR